MSRLQQLIAWVDHRTGVKRLAHEVLFENVPGGARWRYVWGSTLTFALVVQFITGAFLWMAYNPSAQTAWESVYYIQNEMAGGWWLRGIHHFTAQVMTVLLVLHLMQVLIDGAYKAPREVNFWFGLILLKLTLALSLTGYLLPWDQKGYWATKVATNILAITPIIGPALQNLVVGGADYGHHTLSRFFALHAGVLPAAVIALVVGHVYLFRRHGLTEAPRRPSRRQPDSAFWPDQVLKDAVACLAVLLTVLFLVWHFRGAELAPPADPSVEFSAARPDWYFLFLFQFLKAGWLTDFFGHHGELVGAIIIPGIAMAILFAMPILGRWRLGHRFNLVFMGIVLGGATLLTWQAKKQDAANPIYLAAVQQAERDADRVVALAGHRGIPLEGAASLLRTDPLSQGPRIFAAKCASCHLFDGHDGLGIRTTNAASAPDLKGFASREWLTGLLDPERVAGPDYFGGTKHANGKMVKFVRTTMAKYDSAERVALTNAIMALSAEAQLPSQAALDARDAGLIQIGRTNLVKTLACTDCHQFGKDGEDPSGPDLTGYGSREWLLAFVGDPAHTRFYGRKNDRMPAFGREGILSPEELGLVVDWLRGDWVETSAMKPR